MNLRNVRVWDEDVVRDVILDVEGESVDGEGCVLLPSFVDLTCEAGFPGFPARETRDSLERAALAGGFSDLVCSPRTEPVLDTPEQLRDPAGPLAGAGRVALWPVAALTRGFLGEDLTELGSLQAAGAVAIGDGGVALRDTVLLRNAMEYARGFGITLLIRPCDADLDALGVVNDSACAARMGLRGNPSCNEEIGVARIVALVRATGARVHLTHLSSARGVELYRAARAEGLTLTASTPARNLMLDEDALDDGAYDTRRRLHPPLRSAQDRIALVEAVRTGDLWLAADHQPRAPEEKEQEFERAVPGSTGLETAVAAAYTALGDLDALVRALAIGPRSLLGASCVRGGWTLFDPAAVVTVVPSRHQSLARNDALAGCSLRGAVRATWAGARRGA